MKRTLFVCLLFALVSGCGGGSMTRMAAVTAPPMTSNESTASYQSEPSTSASEVPPDQRAGLATQWGESRYSRVHATTFERADATRPLALAMMNYNDQEGSQIQAARASGAEAVPYMGLLDPSSGHRVRVSLRNEYGQSLPAYIVGDRAYVIGQAGQRYSIVIENDTPYRMEAVVSVDGLDVIHGSEASLANRGYIVEAYGTLTIDGFRQSAEAVAAFRFGSVASSYAAQTTGSAANVGVIGVALFGEAGAEPTSLVAEAEMREHANPFPGGFAAPPPVLYVQ